ncbi:MAG: hypothetical protein KGH56_03590 [Patescibacteria group bacterium]|nr:hypothetical protein [Patescibacteria group bacterium]
MSTFLWSVVVAALFLFGVVIYYRLTEPISSKMAKEQSQLNKKTGTDEKSKTTSMGIAPYKKEAGWPEKVLSWNVLLILLGLAVLYWGITPVLKPADVGDWSTNHWLQIFLFCGILWALIALNAESLRTAAGVPQWVLGGVAIMLLVVLPIWSAVSGPAKASVQEKQLEVYFAQGPQSSWPEPSWPTFVLEKKGEKRHFSFPQGTLPALDGEEIRVHCTYRSGLTVSFNAGERACSMNDELSFVVVENLAEGPNAVRYAVYYAPKT